MSHFNEERDGVLLDPTQKTLNNFIVSGDASSKDVDEQRSYGNATSDYIVNHEKSDSFIDSHETRHTQGNCLDSNHSSEPDDDNCTLASNAAQVEKFHNPSSDVTADKVCKMDEGLFDG